MFERPVFGGIVCFVALNVALTIATDVTTAAPSVTVVSPSAASPPKNGLCSKPPSGVSLINCCNLPTPFPEDLLSTCQKAQTTWLKDKTSATCGSRCLLGRVMNISEAIQRFMLNASDTWLDQMQQLPTYFNVLTKCVPTEAWDKFTTKLLGEGAAFTEAICELDLLGAAECFSKEIFLNCPGFVKNTQCQSVKDFLTTPCRYSDLHV
ncbi:uncharacterized protein LOC110680867 [Aedes aegypti]|uniref:Uncharacterized protein n=1 Tax=Aedes aegypti TaxID=7159 RepID=A0A6I8U0T7_AEDAE|nr:uncharacterized protein LOC110676315 [Aedes aegypti]XP_021712348.1 uncharacterized protein LOC110680867 [Aedes aegypti]